MSLSGDYLKKDHQKTYEKIKKMPSGFEKYQKIIKHIKKIDQHLPYDDESIHEIIDLIKPEYIVYEFSANKYGLIDRYIHQQNEILNRL